MGSKNQPSYRVVITDQRSPRDGRFIEIIGNYNPRTDPATTVVNTERAAYWLAHGAQPSEAVARLLKGLGIDTKAAPSEAAGAPAETPAA